MLYNPHRTIDLQTLSIYKNIIIEKSYWLAQYLASHGLCVTLKSPDSKFTLGLTREIFKNAYILITKQLKIDGNNFFEIIESLEKITKLSPDIITAVCLVAIELGFYELSEQDGIVSLVATPTKVKKNLEESKLFNKFQ